MNEDKKLLTEDEIDTIGELLNISMGSAATAVSTMLERQVSITTPRIGQDQFQNIDFSELEPAIVVKINYVKGLSGTNIIVLKRKDMGTILDLLMGNSFSESEDYEFDEMSMSAACEVMNQMMGASATAMSEMLDKSINISTPQAFLIDSSDEARKIFSDIEKDDNVVEVSFKMTIKETLDTTFGAIMPLSLSKEIVRSVSGEIKDAPEEDNQPTQPSHPAAAQPQQPPKTAAQPPQAAQQQPQRPQQPPQAAQQQPQRPQQPPQAAQQQPQRPEQPPQAVQQQPQRLQQPSQAAVQPQPQRPQQPQAAQQQQTQPPQQASAQPGMPPYEQQFQAPPAQAPNAYPYQQPYDPSYQYYPYQQPVPQQPYGQPYPGQYPYGQFNQYQEQQNPRYVTPSLNVKQAEFPDFSKMGATPLGFASNMNMLMGVQLEVSVVIGRAKQKIKDVLEFGQGSVIELDKQTGSPAEIVVNGQLIAYGDVVVVGDNFGIRITDIVGTDKLIDSLEKNNK